MSSYYKVVNLVVQRGSDSGGYPTMSATWGMSGKGFTGDWGYDGWYDEIWTFNASKNMSSKVIQQTGQGDAKGDIVWTRNGNTFHTSASCQYFRNKYHPLTNGRYLNSVTCDVLHASTKNHTKVTYAFKPPRKPSIANPTYDNSNHRVTFNITTNKGEDRYERYDTYYRVTRQDSSNLGSSYQSETNVTNWTSTTDTSKDVSYDYAGASALLTGQWVKITVYAYARGLAGDSATVSKSYVYARPAKASITSIVKSGSSSTDYVTVRLATNATSTAPVDTVKLQRLRSTSITSAAAAGLAEGWEDVDGAVDNGNCTGLTDMVEDAVPTAKSHTWYRVVSTHGAFTANSVPVEAECLYRAKTPQADDAVKFASVIPSSDGTGITVRLAWNSDDSDTTQITWSEFEDAWESTEQPNSCDVTWLDSGGWTDNSVDPPVEYEYASTVTIRSLKSESLYYIRARRALLADESPSYGEWFYPEAYPVSTAVAPTDVVLIAPSVVARGDGIDCVWTFSGSTQTAWQISYMDDGTQKELVSGTGAAGSTVIPVSQVEDMDSVDIAVSVTTGGDWATSDYVSVSIEDRPELSMSVGEVLDVQPASIDFECTSPNAELTIYITSEGVTTATPSGDVAQAEGDVVWADVVSPSWELSNGSWLATVEAPSGLAFYEGGVYSVTAIATDTSTFLSSDAIEGSFSVEWAHEAYIPSDESTITVDGLMATITPATPVIPEGTDDEVEDTDVCDVYRSTPDGAYLIAKDVPFGTPVTDRYAPFSKNASLNYTLCTRTADGDIAWADYGYELKHSALRVDFGNESVELPYNIAMTDAWEKDFELREHLDGTRAGYWNNGATRTASMSTDVMKVESAEQRTALASLAKHSGPCFVRTPDGCAYPANVQVDTYGVTFDSGVVPVTISATEVAMTDAFRISPDDWGE